ncbi:hypothetical protein [Marinoscillum sp.]|uniref:hypothetical protein n=1 Tax=Marinoscillum sp. TaxID=2024838 RepID=UPI003BAD3814
MKRRLFLRILGIMALLVIESCSSPNRGTDNKEAPIFKPTPGKRYGIIDIESDDAFSKATINVRLTEEVSKTELNKIAFQIKADHSKYSKLWIFYFLPEMSTENGAWAISHFKPTLELEIIGTSKTAKEEMKNSQVSSEIQSTWIDNDAIAPNTKYLVKENGKLLMKSVYAKTKYANATEIVNELTKTTQNGLTRYNYQNNFGEFYLVEQNGNLSMYNSDGKFKELKKQ